MSINDVISLINGVGFPIFVSVYLLLSTNKLIENNTNMLNELKISINQRNIIDQNNISTPTITTPIDPPTK